MKKTHIKNSHKKTHISSVANLYVRYLLSEISEALGGFTEKEYKKTLKEFNHCCAYTGKKLKKESITIDHLIPNNRKSGGLHLYGNIVPATDAVNKSKGSKCFVDFLNSDSTELSHLSNNERDEKIAHLKEFQETSGYFDKIQKINYFLDYLEKQYALIFSIARNSLSEIGEHIITTDFSEAYKAVLINLKEKEEIDKVKKRIPIWFKKKDQINSQILIKYLQNTTNSDYIEIADFKKICSKINNFDNALPQMYRISSKNHGKVFELVDNRLYLWRQVESFIKNEFKTHINL